MFPLAIPVTPSSLDLVNQAIGLLLQLGLEFLGGDALELRARDRQRKLIAKIDEALDRIRTGDYGYCEETGEPIGIKRLEARPVATLTVEAQERHERMERTQRDERE